MELTEWNPRVLSELRLKPKIVQRAKSQEEFAKFVGISKSALSRYEDGRMPDTEELLKILRAVGGYIYIPDDPELLPHGGGTDDQE